MNENINTNTTNTNADSKANYAVTYKLNSNGKAIVKKYENITQQTLQKYIGLYTSLSQSTYVSHTTF